MIMYHPYRALLQYLADLEKDKDETFFKLSWYVHSFDAVPPMQIGLCITADKHTGIQRQMYMYMQ